MALSGDKEGDAEFLPAFHASAAHFELPLVNVE